MLTITRRRGRSISKQAYPRAKRRVARALAAEVMAELEVELAAEIEASARMRHGLMAFNNRAAYLGAMGIPDDPFDGESLIEYLADVKL